MHAHLGRWRFLALPLMILALLAANASPVAAVDFRQGTTVTLASGEVINDDMVLVGSTVMVQGTVKGNLFVVANQVVVTGAVNGSVFALGRTVTVTGQVGGSVNVASIAFLLGGSAKVGRNVSVAALRQQYLKGSVVGTGAGTALNILASKATLAGKLQGAVRGAVLQLNIIGDIAAPSGSAGIQRRQANGDRNLTLWLDVPGAGLAGFRSPALNAGSIAGSESDQAPAMRLAESETGEEATQSHDLAMELARDWLTLFLVGLAGILFLPTSFRSTTLKVRTRPAASLGVGALTIPGGYLLAVMSALGLLALWRLLAYISLDKISSLVFFAGLAVWGIVFATFQILVAYGSKVVVSYLVAKLLVERVAKRFAANRFLPLALGLLIYVPLRAIPVFGWLLSVAVTLIGVGAMTLAVRSGRQGAKATMPVVAPAPLEAVVIAPAFVAAPASETTATTALDSTTMTAPSEAPAVTDAVKAAATEVEQPASPPANTEVPHA